MTISDCCLCHAATFKIAIPCSSEPVAIAPNRSMDHLRSAPPSVISPIEVLASPLIIFARASNTGSLDLGLLTALIHFSIEFNAGSISDSDKNIRDSTKNFSPSAISDINVRAVSIFPEFIADSACSTISLVIKSPHCRNSREY